MMKNPLSSLGSVTLLTLSICFMSMQARAFRGDIFADSHFQSAYMGDNLIGGWEYTAAGAPDGYDKGFIMIVGEKGQYTVKVKNGAGVFTGNNVTAKKNSITFSLDIDGDNVLVSLKVSGSQLSGTSTSSQGDYTIKGEKTLSQG